MKHVLKDLHNELKMTHDLIEHYKISGIAEIFFSIFGKSFKKTLKLYAVKKEEMLMLYATIHYDITKDIKNSDILHNDVEYIRINITELTYKVEECGLLLSRLTSHSERQEEILTHEKSFFVRFVQSFQEDLIHWISAHEKEIFGDTTQSAEGKSLESPHELLQKQKQRLEKHIHGIHNTL